MKKIKEFMYVFFFCVPFAIIVYMGCMIGILIFNLIKFMDTKKIKDIEVKDYIDLSATLRQTDIENAKQVLKSSGYYIDNLWQTEDVKINYHCTEEQAQKILNRVLQYDAIYELVWEGISYEAESMNLKHKD